LKQLASEVAMLPQEQVLAVGAGRRSLFIGIPKEISFQEHRVPLNPLRWQCSWAAITMW
jgi:alanine dehydrogenase